MSIETDRIVFLEMQKTGSTFVGDVLEASSLDAWRGSKKHRRVEPDGVGERSVLLSVRDPFSWYVSLWAYGVGGQGTLWVRTTTRGRGGPGPRATLKEHLLYRAVQRVKPVGAFEKVYDALTPANFQAWVRLIHRRRARVALGERWAGSPLSGWAGLYSWRYVYLLARHEPVLYQRAMGSPEGLRALLADGLLPHTLLRNERLGADLVAALEHAGHTLTDDDRARMLGDDRPNTSRHAGPLAYYDAATLDLVHDLDGIVLQHLGYARPTL